MITTALVERWSTEPEVASTATSLSQLLSEIRVKGLEFSKRISTVTLPIHFNSVEDENTNTSIRVRQIHPDEMTYIENILQVEESLESLELDIFKDEPIESVGPRFVATLKVKAIYKGKVLPSEVEPDEILRD